MEVCLNYSVLAGQRYCVRPMFWNVKKNLNIGRRRGKLVNANITFLGKRDFFSTFFPLFFPFPKGCNFHDD